MYFVPPSLATGLPLAMTFVATAGFRYK